MLRQIFGEPRRVDEDALLEVSEAVSAYLKRVHRQERSGRLPNRVAGRLEIWCKGFLSALDELEQSKYCAFRYFQLIRHHYIEQMDQEELDNYHRHVYYFKNAFIRIFAVLDKMGCFLNERLDLRTEKLKLRFSYYTVLRHMHDLPCQPVLEQELYGLKLRFAEPMKKLRKLRNMEVHALNSELADDMQEAQHVAGSCVQLENLKRNVEDLEKGYEMVCLTLKSVFEYFFRQAIY